MRRDYFELEAENVDWAESGGDPAQPTVRIDFRGPDGTFRDRITDADGEILDAERTDVTFRLRDDPDAPDATGVVAVTNRVTGDFVLELNEEVDDVLRFIRAASEYGKRANGDGRYCVHISIDDCGGGYSSLSRLTKLPVNMLKIDRGFVQSMMADSTSLNITRAVIDLAHDLNMEVIAEGVESSREYQILGRMGCQYAQGFYISKPLTARQAERFLTNPPELE
jgi:hypothetical protein